MASRPGRIVRHACSSEADDIAQQALLCRNSSRSCAAESKRFSDTDAVLHGRPEMSALLVISSPCFLLPVLAIRQPSRCAHVLVWWLLPFPPRRDDTPELSGSRAHAFGVELVATSSSVGWSCSSCSRSSRKRRRSQRTRRFRDFVSSTAARILAPQDAGHNIAIRAGRHSSYNEEASIPVLVRRSRHHAQDRHACDTVSSMTDRRTTLRSLGACAGVTSRTERISESGSACSPGSDREPWRLFIRRQCRWDGQPTAGGDSRMCARLRIGGSI